MQTQFRSIAAENIPTRLRTEPRWALWQPFPRPNGKIDKVPYQANHPERKASTKEPRHWVGFDAAHDAYCLDAAFAGIGFLMTDIEDLIGVDLDNCVAKDGTIAPWAQGIVRACATYAELSPSGHGLRLFLRGRLIGGDFTNRARGLEVYGGASGRFLTVTGHRLPGAPTEINLAGPDAVAVLERYRPQPNDNVTPLLPMPELLPEGTLPELADMELAEPALAWLQSGAIGEHDSRSEAIFTAAIELYGYTVRAKGDVDDGLVLSILAANNYCMELARDHRRGDDDRAISYLWLNVCLRARGKARVATIEEFPDLGAPPAGEATDSPFLPPIDAMRVDRFLRAIPPPRRWLVEDLMPLGKVGLLVAPGGTGKTQAGIQLGVSVALGEALCGHWKMGEGGSALLLLAEEDDEEIHRRVHSTFEQISTGAMFDDEDPEREVRVKRLGERLFTGSLVGKDCRLVREGRDGFLVNKKRIDSIIETAKALPDCRLILVDPVSRFRGGDENASEGGTRFIQALEQIAEATGATVLAVHHVSKASMRNHDVDSTAARGASSLVDGARFVLNLRTMSEDEAKAHNVDPALRRMYLRLDASKANYAPPAAEVWLHRLDGGFLKVAELQPKQEAKRQQRESEDARVLDGVMELLREHAAEGRRFTKRQFSDRYGGKERAPLFVWEKQLRQVIDDAIEDGALILQPNAKNGVLVVADSEMTTCNFKQKGEENLWL